MRGRFLAAAVVVAAALGCDDDGKPRGGDGGADVAPDRGSPVDAAVDATADVTVDAARDVTVDATPDVGGEVPRGPDGPAPPATRQLDLVFLIDNSVSMREEQDNLSRAFPAFMNVLQSQPGGLPDLRIGIVSSNFGAGQTQPSPECSPIGDRGVFQVRQNCGLDPGVARWLAIDGKGAQNFQGQLAMVFSCLATLGTSGCGYEHQLQSLRASFAENVASENRGFLRRDAYLGIVILSDEDDCSGEPDSRLYQNPIPGQAGSVRCSLVGHLCGGQPVPATAGFRAPLATCTPVVHGNTSDDRLNRLINLGEFVDWIKALKSFPDDRILVSAVIGWNDDPAAQYGIVGRPSAINPQEQEIDSMPACESAATGSAAPGIRLRAFTRAFARSSVHSICDADLTPAMTEIAGRIAGMMGP